MSQTGAEPSPLRRLWPMVAIVTFGFLAIGLPLPAVPRHVHDTLGYGAIVVGWVVGLQSLVTVVTRPIGGMIVDARGPKAAVLLGLPCAILAGATYVASALLSATPAISVGVLIVGRLLLGLAESLFLTGTMTWGIARVGMASVGRVMAWQGIAMYIALGLGSPVGLALHQGAGFAWVGAAAMLLPAVGIGVALRTPPAVWAKPRRGGGSLIKVIALVWPQGLGLALGSAPFAAMAAFLALHFSTHGWSGAGLAFLLFAAGYIGVRLFLAHLPDRVGGSVVVVVSLLILGAGQLIIGFAGSGAAAIAGALVSGVGFSLVYPSFGVQAMRKAPPEAQGLAVGAFMAFFDVALGLTGPVVGVVAAHFGYGAVFLVTAGCAALAALVGGVSGPRPGVRAGA